MRLVICVSSLSLIARLCADTVFDDFSQEGWKVGPINQGAVRFEKGQLTISGENSKAPVSKTFDVDLEKTPLMLVKIKRFSQKGNLVWIPFNGTQIPAFPEISKPGLYCANIKDYYPKKKKISLKVDFWNCTEKGETVYEYIKFVNKLTDQDRNEIKEAILPAKRENVFELRPTYCSCGYYWQTKGAINGLSVLFRLVEGEWREGLPPVWDDLERIYRGSIVNLEENSEYEIKLVCGDDILVCGKFKTWNSTVPIAKTIVLYKENCKDALILGEKDSGTADGYIRYIASPGFALESEERYAVTIDGAKYIILEGLRIEGGKFGGVKIHDSQNIKMTNCEVAGWGTPGIRRYDKGALLFKKDDLDRKLGNGCGIELRRSRNCVIERCFIHDPVGGSHAWRYSHPMAYSAISVGELESTVLRYNDIIGSDQHRWNDGIAGACNFYYSGGFGADADIYGNMIAFANDDCVELDGGQQNVRFFYNKVEGALTGISVQGCMVGPSYVFRNLIVDMGDEFGASGQLFKTSSLWAGESAVTFLFNNTFATPGTLSTHRRHRIVAKNNLFANRGNISRCTPKDTYTTDYNFIAIGKTGDEEHGVFGEAALFADEINGVYQTRPNCFSRGKGTRIANFATKSTIDIGAYQRSENWSLPYRPVPFAPDKSKLCFSVPYVERDVMVKVGGDDFDVAYSIRKNNVFDWFEVNPSSGRLKSGEDVTFTVRIVPDKLAKQSVNRGVFLIRTAQGYSRPVSVFALTDYKQPVKPNKDGDFCAYIEAEEPVGEQYFNVIQEEEASKNEYITLDQTVELYNVYDFEAPRDGNYFLYFRMKLKHIPDTDSYVGSANIAVDDMKIKTGWSSKSGDWIWLPYTCSRSKPFYLSRGKHTIKIRGYKVEPSIDLIAITENPEPFDFR